MGKKKFLKNFFWKVMLLLPAKIRAKIVRNKFEIDYNIGSEYQVKLVSTKEELEAALNLVYDAYVNLKYTDENAYHLYFTKYLSLPTTTIIVVKKDDEVIGTLSIVLDTALGLPTDVTWNVQKHRDEGHRLAEISTLTIKKGFQKQKGKLIFPLTKLMYLYCRDYLNVNRIVCATTYEVEPFYTDLLLFKRFEDADGQNHSLVKGNKSTACYLDIGPVVEKRYKKIYEHREDSKNLYKYYMKTYTSNLVFPQKLSSIQAQLRAKNSAIGIMLDEKELLCKNFTDKDKLVISSLTPNHEIKKLEKTGEIPREYPRISTFVKCFVVQSNSNQLSEVVMVDISKKGVCLKTLKHEFKLNQGEKIRFIFEDGGEFEADVMWVRGGKMIGCKISQASEKSWDIYFNKFWEELGEEELIA